MVIGRGGDRERDEQGDRERMLHDGFLLGENGSRSGPDPEQPHQRLLRVALLAQVDLAVQRPEVVAARVESTWVTSKRRGPAARSEVQCARRASGVNRIAPYSARNGASAASKRAASQGSSGSWCTQRAASS